MPSTKQVVMFSSRAFTLRRAGLPSLHITAGRNLIDADVAEHPYVKAHATGPMTSDAQDAEALLAAQARIGELEGYLELANKSHAAQAENILKMSEQLEAQGQTIAQLEAQGQTIAQLEAALEAKTADMDAMLQSMSQTGGDATTTPAPVLPKPKK